MLISRLLRVMLWTYFDKLASVPFDFLKELFLYSDFETRET